MSQFVHSPIISVVIWLPLLFQVFVLIALFSCSLFLLLLILLYTCYVFHLYLFHISVEIFLLVLYFLYTFFLSYVSVLLILLPFSYTYVNISLLHISILVFSHSFQLIFHYQPHQMVRTTCRSVVLFLPFVVLVFSLFHFSLYYSFSEHSVVMQKPSDLYLVLHQIKWS